MLDTTDINLPRHVGVIMDGNGRWAKKRGVARWEGHREGARVFRRIGEYAADIGVKYLTFYAFSTENWSRPPEEVAAIMQLFREYLIEGDERLAENEEKGMRLRFIGDRHGLPEDIVNLIEKAERESADKSRVYVNIALNYGGRDEIVESVRSIAERVASGEMKPEDITGDDIASGLYPAGQPDPDLIIRPSGEYRLSNFLLWQSAYAEFWYSDVLWPDFTTDDFDRAVEAYSKRNRRFGNIG